MAFSFQYFARVEITQELDKTLNTRQGELGSAIPSVWIYNAFTTAGNASTAQTQASGYFNGALGYLSVGDIIYVYSNDPGYHILNVATNAAGTVTTAQIV